MVLYSWSSFICLNCFRSLTNCKGTPLLCLVLYAMGSFFRCISYFKFKGEWAFERWEFCLDLERVFSEVLKLKFVWELFFSGVKCCVVVEKFCWDLFRIFFEYKGFFVMGLKLVWVLVFLDDRLKLDPLEFFREDKSSWNILYRSFFIFSFYLYL